MSVHADRLDTLARKIETIPIKKFDMAYWAGEWTPSGADTRPAHPERFRGVGACGTVGCVLGWAAMIPEFQRAGLSFHPRCLVPQFEDEFGARAGADFFGLYLEEAHDLFLRWNVEHPRWLVRRKKVAQIRRLAKAVRKREAA